MKVYIDFDRTLFDCDRFLEDLYSLINKYMIPKTTFKECQGQCKKKGFNPHNILDLVKEKYDFDEKLYTEVSNLIRNSSSYLYQDTLPFLDYLKSLNYEIIILTKGNSNYQREKIFNARIDSYYNKLIVTMKHKGELDIDYINSIFIDDNPIEISSLIKKKPKRIIRIKRDGSLYANDELNLDIDIVESLNEIIEKKIIN